MVIPSTTKATIRHVVKPGAVALDSPAAIANQNRRVAGAPWLRDRWNCMAGDVPRRLDDFAHAKARAVAKVEVAAAPGQRF